MPKESLIRQSNVGVNTGSRGKGQPGSNPLLPMPRRSPLSAANRQHVGTRTFAAVFNTDSEATPLRFQSPISWATRLDPGRTDSQEDFVFHSPNLMLSLHDQAHDDFMVSPTPILDPFPTLSSFNTDALPPYHDHSVSDTSMTSSEGDTSSMSILAGSGNDAEFLDQTPFVSSIKPISRQESIVPDNATTSEPSTPKRACHRDCSCRQENTFGQVYDEDALLVTGDADSDTCTYDLPWGAVEPWERRLHYPKEIWAQYIQPSPNFAVSPPSPSMKTRNRGKSHQLEPERDFWNDRGNPFLLTRYDFSPQRLNQGHARRHSAPTLPKSPMGDSMDVADMRDVRSPRRPSVGLGLFIFGADGQPQPLQF